MLLEPAMTENIIVGVMWKGRFRWYVTEKEIWFMDSNKMKTADEKKWKEYGLPLSNLVYGAEDPEREGIPILDENTIELFSLRIEKYAVTVDELRELLEFCIATESRVDVFYDFLPSLYLDFDNRCLYSMYTEPASFEDYVPQNWKGEYFSFLDIIEKDQRYWQSNDTIIFDFKEGDGNDYSAFLDQIKQEQGY